ncbi:hypothetical protein V8E36_000957 [Tilletia maclaganii]
MSGPYRDSFNSQSRGHFQEQQPQHNNSSSLYFDQTLDTPDRKSEAGSWYSGAPLADVAAQHSSSSPLAGTGRGAMTYEKAALPQRSERGGFIGWCKRKPCLALLLLILLLAAIGGAVGGALAAMSTNKDSDSSNSNSAADTIGNHNNNSNGNHNNNGNTGTNTTKNEPAPAPIVALQAWDWTDPRQKVMGVSLGNYLCLERWLDEDWFRSVAGPDSWDEWDLHQNLGPQRTAEVLAVHQRNFIQESDFDQLVEYGLNTIRVPIPFWSLIPTTGNEPYHNTSQLDRLADVMQWSHKRGLYVIVDLHSMPGSQSGDQASGHNTSSPQFWTSANQARSVQTIQALIQWINNNPYKSVVSAVTPVNEPRAQVGFHANDAEKLAILRTFYQRSYSLLSAARLPMLFHPSFYVGDALDHWADFVTGKDPNMLIYSVHPYPGFFPSTSDVDAMTSAVCTHARNSIGYPVPVMYGEWSAISGIETNSYMRRYYTTQLTAWSWSAGGVFWTYKAPQTQTPVLANTGLQETMFSFKDLMDMGVIPKPASPLSSNPKDYGAFEFIQSLGGGACGPIPTSQIRWSNPASYGAAYSGRRRR